MFVSAIIAAGGRGQRFGSAVPKQLLAIDGQSALERSVTLFLTHPGINEVIVALPSELVAAPPSYLRVSAKPLRIVPGGERRQDSVANAFSVVADEADVVVVHDAARPFASAGLVSRTIEAAVESGAALAALPARDTVKRTDGVTPFVSETIPREAVHLAQTPQAFSRRVLREALALASRGPDATDEASLAERAGFPVRLVEGEAGNVKITTPDDLVVVDALARRRREDAEGLVVRVGTGYDLHRLVEGRALVLGGIVVPAERGALGHSDADVVCHAATDAIFGAAALGDIGSHFPDSDAQWKDASSVDLLRRAVSAVQALGWSVVNLDVTIVLERPKIRGYVDAMRRSVAEAVGVDPEAISIKGKTNEGVDATGRGEAVAAHAVALLRRR